MNPEPTLDIVTARTEAAHWLQIRVGDEPLIADEESSSAAVHP